ncbi:hypothetical protein [Hymenobacter sp.]|uniref:hypothetical protein n=1 Tax=Hymenobacter sp. TaxID=1898978 RepID=UPI00286B1EBF|nr:hypothetical protein [Hymenobacter sp.]
MKSHSSAQAGLSSTTGTNRQGKAYSVVIGPPLLKKFAVGCARHSTAGTVTVTNAQEKSMLFN